ncbi:unnamed protein product [Camellia sinensis]
MNLMSWNIRGLGKSVKRGRIRKLICDRRVDFVLLQETKKTSISESEVRTLWGRRDMEFMAVDSEGLAGGLLCIWDPSLFQLKDCCSNRRFVLLSGTLLKSFDCVILNVYAPNDVNGRGMLWDTLIKLKSDFPNPWCLGGDFNEIRFIGERGGCSGREKGMKELNAFIDKCELNDIPLLGRKYTWCNAQEGEKWSRIDRVLLNPEWLQRFNFKLWGLPRTCSDHCPLLLMEDERDWGPRPFRFINAWIMHPGFLSVMEKFWTENRITGSAGYILLHKLKLLKGELKKWNSEVFGNVATKLKEAEVELHGIDITAEDRTLSESEKNRRREVTGEVWKLSRMLERIWHQKSRVNWILNGDRNTKFFHVMASSRRNRNSINSISIDGVDMKEPETVRLAVLQHFRRQFTESWAIRPTLGGIFKSVAASDAFSDLEAAFSAGEVRAAIMDCDGNKAPGPDGFNLLFFQKFWKVLKSEVLHFMRDFHTTSKLSCGINSSFITLIPKNDTPNGLADFRPISLVGSMYKILSKVLAHRLTRVLPEVIGDSQSAFLGGRSILDGVFIANEIVDGWKKARKKGMLIKLDFEKAYDSINWEFLFSMLANFGFGSKWTSWMRACVSTARLSVLVNGSPTEEFSPQKGLRQGDSLSPFLFIIVAEGLNILMHRAHELGIIKGVKVGAKEVMISHLQFADDSMLFCEADLEQIVHIKRVLRCFEILSGMRINFHKSVVCGVGVDVEALSSCADILNCKVQGLPMKFLGLPLGANPGRKSTWKPVLDKVKARLAGWKRRTLSFAGRLTLIKSALSSLPIYYLSLFRMPNGVVREIEKLQAAFLWGGNDLKRKVHLVKWAEVTKSREQGGLGIRRIKDVNSSLLLKWWWKFGKEVNALWRRLLCSKYRIEEGSWTPLASVSHSHSRVWTDIITVAKHHQQLVEFYVEKLRLRVGNGTRIKFWHDRWLGSRCLKAEFPRIFSLSIDKGGSLLSFYDRRSSVEEWNFIFRRNLYDWEKDEVNRLVVVLKDAPPLRSNVEDCATWNGTAGCLKVSGLYKFSDTPFGPHLSLGKFVWNTDLPPKVQFFGWLAWRNRVKTRGFLQHIGILNSSASILCAFCENANESAAHVLLHCPFSWKVWSDLLQWWGCLWVVPRSVDRLFYWWLGGHFKSKVRRLWRVLPLIALWSIWKCRNDCIFNGVQPCGVDLSELIKVRFALWSKASRLGNMYSVNDFINNIDQVKACV